MQSLHVVERVERFLAAASVARSAEQWVDVVCHKGADEAVRAVTLAGLEMVAAHPEGELLPEDLAAIPRVAIVLGNERDGISEDLAARCARRVRVPMRGFVESLNVSVTAAILLASATRGREGDLDEEARHEAVRARALLLDTEGGRGAGGAGARVSGSFGGGPAPHPHPFASGISRPSKLSGRNTSSPSSEAAIRYVARSRPQYEALERAGLRVDDPVLRHAKLGVPVELRHAIVAAAGRRRRLRRRDRRARGRGPASDLPRASFPADRTAGRA